MLKPKFASEKQVKVIELSVSAFLLTTMIISYFIIDDLKDPFYPASLSITLGILLCLGFIIIINITDKFLKRDLKMFRWFTVFTLIKLSQDSMRIVVSSTVFYYSALLLLGIKSKNLDLLIVLTGYFSTRIYSHFTYKNQNIRKIVIAATILFILSIFLIPLNKYFAIFSLIASLLFGFFIETISRKMLNN